MFGYTAAEIIGQPILKLVPAEIAHEEIEILARLSRGERIAHFETVRVRKDGKRLEVDVTISPIHDNGGTIVGASKIVRNVSDRKASEKQFRSVVEASPSGLVLVDNNGLIALVNSQAELLFGYSRPELIGEPIEKLVPARFRSSHLADRAGYIGHPQARSMGMGRELYGLRKDGTEFPIEIGLNPLEMDGAQMVLSAIVDITARKIAEQAVKDSEAKYRDIFLNAIEGIYRVTSEFKIIDVNPAFARIYGYASPEELLASAGSTTEAVKHNPVDMENLDLILKEHGFVRGYEMSFLRRDGQVVWISANVRIVRDAQGNVLYREGTVADITDRKLSEEKLQATLDDLARSNSELEQFAYVASHDLQEPLRMVSSYVQLLAKKYQGQLDSDADDFIGFAVDGAARMQRLISDLLMFSRVGTRGKEFVPCNCEAILDDALANLQKVIEETGSQVTHDQLPTILADKTQLTQLFQNLIENGIKFRRKEIPQIHVSAVREGADWRFSVRDNGIGIDKEYFDRIFIIFQRLHDKTAYKGTGIGLSVCRKIVERHGGRIWVDSTPGGGSTFSFTLPSQGE
jgi:PAS domain S-box-containing protein